MPGAAFEVFGKYQDSRGTQPPSDDPNLRSFNGTSRTLSVETAAKLEPTVQGTLTGFFQYVDQKTTDQRAQFLPNGPAVLAGTTLPINQVSSNDQVSRLNIYEAAYYHRFNPQAGFLAYYAHRDYPFHYNQGTFGNYNFDFGLGPMAVFENQYLNGTFDRSIDDVQFQQHLKLELLGQHNLIGGFDYFNTHANQRINFLFTGDIPALPFSHRHSPAI